MMAIGYLILIIYFWSRGGYQAQVLLEHEEVVEAERGTHVCCVSR